MRHCRLYISQQQDSFYYQDFQKYVLYIIDFFKLDR